MCPHDLQMLPSVGQSSDEEKETNYAKNGHLVYVSSDAIK